jgi:hypothetical protein
VPRGPQGQRQPADVIGAAVVARIAAGEIEDTQTAKFGRTRSGATGAKARAQKLSPEDRKKIAKKAASAWWR